MLLIDTTMNKTIKIHTANFDTGSRGGYGYVMSMGQRLKKFPSEHHYVDTTMNRLELRACIEALERCDPSYRIEFHTESKYIALGIVAYAYMGDKKRLKVNGDLWQRLFDAIDKYRKDGGSIYAYWMRGPDTLSKMAYKMAMEGQSSMDPKVCGKRSQKKIDYNYE